MAEDDNLEFFIGQTFNSSEDFKKHRTRYQEQHLVLFTVYKSEKLKNDSEKGNEEYEWVKFHCKNYGLPRVNKALTGERPVQKTYKIGCTSKLYLSRNKQGQLEVREFVANHCHPCNEDTYYGYPENRHLSKKSLEEVEKFTKLKAKPMLMKPLLKQNEDPNKLILGRDVHNARAKQKKVQRDNRSEEEMLMAKLNQLKQQDPGATAHLEYDQDSKACNFVLLQTSAMKAAVKKFPEVMLMDSTYKINSKEMPVVVIQVMDGEGVGQDVAYGIVARETKQNLTNLLHHFVQESGGEEVFQKTKCAVVDKDFSEIGALRAVLPGAKIHICSVHTERNVKKAAKGDPNKKESMDKFRKMLYAESEEDFQQSFKDFCSVAGKPLKDYVTNNWLNLKEAWCLKDRALVTTFRIHSTNHTESENQKFKLAMDVNTSLDEGVDILVNVVQKNREDILRYRDHETLTKQVYVNNCSDPLVSKVCNEVTMYAAKLLCEQFQLSKKPSPASERYVTTISDCTCIYFKTLALPCRHVMRFRKSLDMNWYTKEIIPERWHKEFNLGWWKPQQSEPNTPSIQPRMPGKAVKKIMGPSEKFNEVAPILKEVQSIVANNSGTMVFHERCQFLKDVQKAWSKGETVQIVHLSHATQGATAAEDQPSSSLLKNGSSANEKDVPFTIPCKKITGRPRGLGETVHDGSKKSNKLASKSVIPTVPNICCICEEQTGSHRCKNCEELVHAIMPCSTLHPTIKDGRTRLCKDCADQSNTVVSSHEDDDEYELILQEDNEVELLLETANGNARVMNGNDVSQTDRQTEVPTEEQGNDMGKLNSQEGDLNYCCSCDTAAGNHKCTICKESVHAINPCSIRDPTVEEGYGKGRICRNCADETTACVSSDEEHNEDDLLLQNSHNNAVINDVLSNDNAEAKTIDDAASDSEDNTANIAGGEDDDIFSTNDNAASVPEDKTANEAGGEDDVVFTLNSNKCKGRPKAIKKRTAGFSFRSLADTDIICCICEKEAHQNTQCSKCKNFVHAVSPCSLECLQSKDKRICNFCCDFSFEEYHGVPQTVSKQMGISLKAPYFCFGCGKLLKIFVAKNPKDASRKGDMYYGCLQKMTLRCKPWGFWAPKNTQKVISNSVQKNNTYMGFHLDNEGDETIRAVEDPTQSLQRASQKRNGNASKGQQRGTKRKCEESNDTQASLSQTTKSGRNVKPKKMYTPTK